MKKTVLFIAAALVCVSAFVLFGGSEEAEAEVSDDSGSCGENVTYVFDSVTGTLTIRGSGAMKGYSSSNNLAPWYSYGTSVKTIVIGNSVTSIGKEAFYGCTSLTSVTIGDSVTSIGDHAFADCTSLKSLTIPDSVTSIGDYAFSWCTSLTSVTIGDSVTSIGKEAFDGCTSLTSVTVEIGRASCRERV